MNLLQNYKKIVDKIKEHIKTELEKRYDDIEFDDDNYYLLKFTIKEVRFFTVLHTDYINIFSDTEDVENINTFESLFKYIDDVISEEA